MEDRIQIELDELHGAILTVRDELTQNRLYAAQQALAWALNPEAATSPCDMILNNADAAFSACAYMASERTPEPVETA